MESDIVPIRDKPTQVEVVTVDTSLGVKGIHAKEVEPRPEDVIVDDALTPGSLGSPRWDLVVSSLGSSLPGDSTKDDVILSLGSLDMVDPWATELGLSGYPGMLSPPAS
jgi:hypothetical protein